LHVLGPSDHETEMETDNGNESEPYLQMTDLTSLSPYTVAFKNSSDLPSAGEGNKRRSMHDLGAYLGLSEAQTERIIDLSSALASNTKRLSSMDIIGSSSQGFVHDIFLSVYDF
jgi:hypothetical protein